MYNKDFFLISFVDKKKFIYLHIVCIALRGGGSGGLIYGEDGFRSLSLRNSIFRDGQKNRHLRLFCMFDKTSD